MEERIEEEEALFQNEPFENDEGNQNTENEAIRENEEDICEDDNFDAVDEIVDEEEFDLPIEGAVKESNSNQGDIVEEGMTIEECSSRFHNT